MKFIQILFSTPMVKAILEGRKTMTRRIIKPQPINNTEIDGNFFEGNHKGYVKVDGHPNWQRQFAIEFSKFQPGDVLWVRERCFNNNLDKNKADWIYYADGTCCEQFEQCECSEVGKPKWKPSIHMPKSACRIFLEVTDVRVERLQDITEDDAVAEGVQYHKPVPGDGLPVYKNYTSPHALYNAKASFITLWCSINGAESYDSNPWVWVISFKRIDKPENF